MILAGYNPYIYNASENISDLILEYLEEAESDSRIDANYNQPQIAESLQTILDQKYDTPDGGIESLAVKSHQKAKLTIILSLIKSGKNILTTYKSDLIEKDLKKLNRYGIEIRPFEFSIPYNLENLIDENTNLIYINSNKIQSNGIGYFESIVTVANNYDIPVVVDINDKEGFYIPQIINDASIILASTKYLFPEIQSQIGAMIIDTDKYYWLNPKFPFLKSYLQGIQTSFSIINYFKVQGNIPSL